MEAWRFPRLCPLELGGDEGARRDASFQPRVLRRGHLVPSVDEPSPAMAMAAIRSTSPAPRVPLPLPFMCRIDLVRVECTSEGLLVKAAMSVGVSSAPRVWLGGLSAEDTPGAAGGARAGAGACPPLLGACASRALKSLGAGDADSPRCSVARDAAASTSLAVRCMGGKPRASPGSSVCISSNRLPWTPLLDRNSDMTAM